MTYLRKTKLVLVLSAAFIGMIIPATSASALPELESPIGTETETASLVDRYVECYDIDEESFCLYLGFVKFEPGSKEWDAMLAEDAQTKDLPGDATLTSMLRSVASMPETERLAFEQRQLEAAREAVGKVKLIDYVGFGVPIPKGFFDTYPQLGIAEGSPQAEALRATAASGADLDLSVFHTPTAEDVQEEQAHLKLVDFPLAEVAMSSASATMSKTSAPSYRYLVYWAYQKQEAFDYCGPTTMQSIDYGDDGDLNSQDFWASKVGTGTKNDNYSTWMSKMVDTINTYTAWDNLAGSYNVVSTSSLNSTWFWNVHQIVIGVYGAPIVDHSYLKTLYFPYLYGDHGYHYQTGRGYSTTSNTIAIFEPLNEADWPPGNATGKIQYVPYSYMYNANKALPSSLETIGY